MKLIVATRNPYKTREIQRILGLTFEVQDLSAHGEIPEIRESGRKREA
jgi:inosine/xanthosine triphosphate pyrophosphatase family protein